jgi:hypothetical protein
MATKANLVIDQGATFTAEIILTDPTGNPFDLSDFTVDAQMRRWFTSSTSISFNTEITDATAGVLILSLEADETAALTESRYVYDVLLTDAANVIIRVVEGIATVNPSVTRE